MIKATFQNISKQIVDLVLNSRETICISVAWFTNKEILGLLTEKAKSGLTVKIIVSDDIINKRLKPVDFLNANGQFYILQTDSSRFLHTKFAIFDNETLVSGSYNWTYSAEYKNHESIIISNDSTLVKQFKIRFEKLLEIVTKYEIELLVNKENTGADLAEKEFENLEKELEDRLLDALKESKRLHAKINFDFVYSFIKSYGAIGASKRLMLTGTDKIQSGFIKMWELDRIDLTFENIIIDKKFKFLFDNKIIEIANKRLEKFKKSSR
jgi:phosphatidylserine/phosphatidylglycerophosphate/cardiolipin synthase-like enzyme